MQLSETVKLYLNEEQRSLLVRTMDEYIETVNDLVSSALNGAEIQNYSSKDVEADLPSALKNQCIRDARSLLRRYNRQRKTNNSPPVLKRPCCYINSQNYRIKGDRIEFPVSAAGKPRRLSVRTRMSEKQKEVFVSHKLGTLRIVFKNKRIVAQIVYEVKETEPVKEGKEMGVDLGIKCPAVACTSDGLIRFYGNGRKNKYMRRRYASLRKKLQKEKHMDTVRRINSKEQRIMKDIDHKISRKIVDTAVSKDVKVIKLEQLANIRSSTRTSRKNNHSLHSWSFYRLSKFIEYKARKAGITVAYVDPAYTSQRCPVCGSIHHAKDRTYTCKCGFAAHRDILGAMNICNATEYVGGSDIRHTA